MLVAGLLKVHLLRMEITSITKIYGGKDTDQETKFCLRHNRAAITYSEGQEQLSLLHSF